MTEWKIQDRFRSLKLQDPRGCAVCVPERIQEGEAKAGCREKTEARQEKEVRYGAGEAFQENQDGEQED